MTLSKRRLNIGSGMEKGHVNYADTAVMKIASTY